VPIMDSFSVLPASATRIESEAVLKLGLSRIAGPSLAHARLVSPWRTQLLIALHRYSPVGVGGALDYAHLRGMLHRDVKPANILLTNPEDGQRRILLADFGIARRHDDIIGLTATNMTVGTVMYSAPEQLMGSDINGRADQYALAATAFHLLSGGAPVTGDVKKESHWWAFRSLSAISLSLQPQSDGTLRGVQTLTVVSSECGDQGDVYKTPLVATRIGDVPPAVVLADPALFQS
jgi:serine/threonine protein kinase